MKLVTIISTIAILLKTTIATIYTDISSDVTYVQSHNTTINKNILDLKNKLISQRNDLKDALFTLFNKDVIAQEYQLEIFEYFASIKQGMI